MSFAALSSKYNFACVSVKIIGLKKNSVCVKFLYLITRNMSQFHIYWFSLAFLSNHSGKPGVTRQLSKIKKKLEKNLTKKTSKEESLSHRSSRSNLESRGPLRTAVIGQSPLADSGGNCANHDQSDSCHLLQFLRISSPARWHFRCSINSGTQYC